MLSQQTRESLAAIQAAVFDPEHQRAVMERRRRERESLIRWLRQLEGQSERAAEKAKAEGRHKFAAKMRRVAVSCRARLERLGWTDDRGTGPSGGGAGSAGQRMSGFPHIVSYFHQGNTHFDARSA